MHQHCAHMRMLGTVAPQVYVATSFAVRPASANSTAGRNEGLQLPASDGKVGSLQLVAGVGYLPAVQVCAHAAGSPKDGSDRLPDQLTSVQRMHLRSILSCMPSA